MRGGEKHTAVLTHMLASAHRTLIENLVKSVLHPSRNMELGKGKVQSPLTVLIIPPGKKGKEKQDLGMRHFHRRKQYRYLQDHLQDSIFLKLTDILIGTLSLGPHLISTHLTVAFCHHNSF